MYVISEHFSLARLTSGRALSRVTILEVTIVPNIAAKHTATNRGVGDDRNTQLARCFHEAYFTALDVKRKWPSIELAQSGDFYSKRSIRVFNLHCVYMLNLAGSTQCLAGDLREANVTDFAFLL